MCTLCGNHDTHGNRLTSRTCLHLMCMFTLSIFYAHTASVVIVFRKVSSHVVTEYPCNQVYIELYCTCFSPLSHTCNSFVQLETLSAAVPGYTRKGPRLHNSSFIYAQVATADLWFHEVHRLQHELSIIIM